MKFALLAVLFAFILAVNSKPQKPTEEVYGELRDENAADDSKLTDDYGDMDEPDGDEELSPPDETPPKLLSPEQNVVALNGENITLYCNVSNIGGSVILWKKDGGLIYQASTKFGNNMLNTKVENDGQSFHIFHVNKENIGTYECSILLSQGNGLHLTHSVHIKMAPVITSLTSETNQTVFDVGATMHLICKATGYPAPTISWHTEKENLDITGERLTIDNMKFKDARYYRCLADNKIGNPAHEAISIHVNHKPIISLDKFEVNTDNNLDVELKCQYRGYPAPIVNWQKDGHNIQSVGNYNVKNDHHNLILTITNVAERDFDNYTCSAKNSVGKSEKSIRVVKTPVIGHVSSKKVGKDTAISVKVLSKSEISKHDLEYRKKGESKWNTVNPEVLPPDSDNFYSIEHLLKNLEAGIYETRVRSENAHGWATYSNVHEFTAKHHNNKHKNKVHKEKEVKVQAPVYTQETNQKETLLEAHDSNTPASHQETKQKETHVGASLKGSSAMVASSWHLISIALLFTLRQVEQ